MDSYNTIYKGSDDIQMSRLVNEEDDIGTSSLLKRKWKTLTLALGLLSVVCTPCDNQSCFNGGLCKSVGDNFTCTCRPVFSGNRCEVGSCDSSPCLNGGICDINGNTYSCTCLRGFSGGQCQMSVCDSNPCSNGGLCQVKGANYKCTCDSGFSGDQCDGTPCDNQPCFNGGLCKSIGDNFTCTCQPGFSGYRCEVGPCDSSPCLNGGTCDIKGNTHSCTCLRGFSGGQCQTCGRAKVDIVIILDSSTSVGYDNYQKMKNFCKDLLKKADLGSGNIQVGIVLITSAVRIEFHMNTFSTSQDIMEAIDDLPYIYGSTHTFDALNKMRSQMFTAANGDRDGVPNVAVILTDGVSNLNSGKTILEAEQARAEGIHIYAIGIGLSDTRELDAMASRPASKNSFKVKSFDELAVLNDQVFRTFCSGKQ
ncbi:Delta-like protein 1,Neurogenic locus notch homolog protein 2,Fibropellin-3,Delta-like protein 4,Sushi, nidogen and EGF-like domain-containing protein 1,Sushi, von Willebrand factor type A, EGF and pentraxin domain-containing protein 1,Delta-like protein C,Fibropellin-1,Delta-like protein B,Neurogenic locus notch homolog protein 1 [Mytilus coruscus]|uniref:Uncharacterized protein n=1 Tax=Mytilus coruscus TaxID=42192 RepID=A0A6J8BZF3_MYTCO|nr:Delta-like protein 1,Neurogenic locus notch homolog protein 2,Fibropellin-3,Delta-like protein 4,Sushi, nidogen and EGF-like domain-containing protein 1,Sushi, von Willebrand factor type A, EGF and pentraxin domain-containing protein 1,Delta-like protein C,Fibropellin-1,Delta-like protein B,Neurogenic locus notch homolog protein 1 [Mytilus coruscus]